MKKHFRDLCYTMQQGVGDYVLSIKTIEIFWLPSVKKKIKCIICKNMTSLDMLCKLIPFLYRLVLQIINNY